MILRFPNGPGGWRPSGRGPRSSRDRIRANSEPAAPNKSTTAGFNGATTYKTGSNVFQSAFIAATAAGVGDVLSQVS